ncbi:hypothetical protein ASC71_03435 [Rhizobium sp. Root1240]|nr:hypothetical protein ASC71_03435 [Rhizobium sp. Root1240]
MIVSGFVISNLVINKREPYTRYIFRRFWRLYPVHIIGLTVALMLYYVGLPIYGVLDGAAWKYWLIGATMFHGLVPQEILVDGSRPLLQPNWSISVEFQFYLLAPTLIAVLYRPTALKTLASAAAIVSLMVVGIAQSRSFELFGISFTYPHNSHILYAFRYFMIGIASFLVVRQIPQGSHRLELKSATCVGVLLFLLVFICTKSVGIAVWAGFCPFLFVDVSESSISFKAGQMSYSVYLLHMIVVSLLSRFLPFDGWLHFFLLSAASVPLIALVSWHSYRFIEKPMIDFARQVSDHNTGRAAN